MDGSAKPRREEVIRFYGNKALLRCVLQHFLRCVVPVWTSTAVVAFKRPGVANDSHSVPLLRAGDYAVQSCSDGLQIVLPRNRGCDNCEAMQGPRKRRGAVGSGALQLGRDMVCSIALEVVRLKFRKCRVCGITLLKTRDATIVEAAMSDRVWGIGVSTSASGSVVLETCLQIGAARTYWGGR